MTDTEHRPLYWRLLRLHHLRPNSWQRGLLGEGAFVLAAILVLADLASAWLLIVLPVAVALVVKAHDMLSGLLHPTSSTTTDDRTPEGTPRAGIDETDLKRKVSPPKR